MQMLFLQKNIYLVSIQIQSNQEKSRLKFS